MFLSRLVALDLDVRDLVYFDREESRILGTGTSPTALNSPLNPSMWYDPNTYFTNAIQLRLG
jgi:hypothetical protein